METSDRHGAGHYPVFVIEIALDFVVMYLVMYSMIATLDDFYLNINNVYMTLMMVAPMAVIMLVAMRSMFASTRLNWIVVLLAALLFVAGFAGMRTQAAVGNAQFLRSMIPHHSGAILMCEEAPITDPEIIALCQGIISSQQQEIATMRTILERID